MDNVSQIAVHDPNGDRFPAAQLFVDLAQPGDRIGTVKISSSLTPEQTSGYHGLMNMDANGKSEIKHILTSQVFGDVEGKGRTDVPAYITPALQTAEKMLISSPSNNRRYVIMVTDAVALSGDQNNCSGAPPNHNWFCAIHDLTNQHISFITLGFTKPGSEAALTPTRDYIEANGGTVLQVEDGANLFPRLAVAYTDLLTRIHQTMFYANVFGDPSSLQIDSRASLLGITFVALGDPGVSLIGLRTPSNVQVAGRSTNDGSFYNSSPPNTGYWIETVRNGTTGGTWHLEPGNTPPQEILVIAISEAHFDLLNPAPANPDSEASVRYIPQQGPLVLRAKIVDTEGQPFTQVPFVANPLSNPISFKGNALPGHSTSEIDATIPSVNSTASTFQVGIGNAIVPGVYLTKSFRLVPRPELGLAQLTIPSPTVLTLGASIYINAQGATIDPAVISSSLAIYGRDPTPGMPWQLIDSGSFKAGGNFSLLRGCGVAYTFIAVDEIRGQLEGGEYDYITYTQGDYTSELQQTITGQAILSPDNYLEWWSSQAHWTVSFTSTTCSPQNVALGVGLHSSDSPPLITIENGQGYSIEHGIASFTVLSTGKLRYRSRLIREDAAYHCFRIKQLKCNWYQ